MSTPIPDDVEPGGRSSPPPHESRATDRAARRLSPPPPGSGRKLFLILNKARKNLKREISPRQPKSIWTKAYDLSRNLPHWQSQVDGEASYPHNGAELARQRDVSEEVCRVAIDVLAELGPLVERGVRDDAQVEQAWNKLREVVGLAMRQIVGEFGPLDKPDTQSSKRGAVPGAPGKAASDC